MAIVNNPGSTPIPPHRLRNGLLVGLGALLLLSSFILQQTPELSADPVVSSELNASRGLAVHVPAGARLEHVIVNNSVSPEEIAPAREAATSEPEASVEPAQPTDPAEPEGLSEQVSPAQPNDPPESVMVVELTNTLTFSPLSITIRAGETVEWRNTSLMVHTVTADPSKATVDGSVSLPSGGQPFDSGNLNPEATFRHTFRTPGTYRYFCIPHEGVRMRGTVIVR